MDIPSIQVQEISEIHEYIRQVMTLYVTWFTFFILVLFGAMSWSLKAGVNSEGTLVKRAPYFFVLALFGIQIALGIAATHDIRKDFEGLDQRALHIAQSIVQPRTSSFTPASPVPRSLHQALVYMECTLWTNLVFWGGVGFYVYRRKGLQLFGNVTSVP